MHVRTITPASASRVGTGGNSATHCLVSLGADESSHEVVKADGVGLARTPPLTISLETKSLPPHIITTIIMGVPNARG